MEHKLSEKVTEVKAAAKKAAIASAPSDTPPATPAKGDGKVEITVHLRNIPLLAELSPEEMERVKSELRIRRYARRDVVMMKGANADNLQFLLAGQAQVTDVTEDGRAIGLRILSPGEFFGEIALINNTKRSASVVALSECLVAALPGATAMHMFTHSPSVAKQMLRHLAQKVQQDSEFRALLSIQNTSQRIFGLLEMLKQKTPENQEVVENLPTHQDIANMINTSRETVTRALLALTQQGVVQKDARRLIIIKPDVLQKLSQPS